MSYMFRHGIKAHPRGPLCSSTPAAHSRLRHGLWTNSALALLVWTGCAHFNQTVTPMHSACRELPTIEECQAAAQVITHECLRKCVELQCAGVKVNCGSEEIQKQCQKRTNRSTGEVALGYVERFFNAPTSCDKPSKEVNWCE